MTEQKEVRHASDASMSPIDRKLSLFSDHEPTLQQLRRCLSYASEPESPTMQSSMVFNGPEISENSQLQLRWDRAMCKQLDLPLGYGQVSVLLVKWNEDEFQKTEEEVSRSLFYSYFNHFTNISWWQDFSQTKHPSI
jgi:hypothetical protein